MTTEVSSRKQALNSLYPATLHDLLRIPYAEV